MPVKGVQRVKVAMHKSLQEKATVMTFRAVYAILSQGATMASLLTPVDTSNLINSQYRPSIDNNGSGHVGYTAEYAYWVHEMPGTLKGQPRENFGSAGFGGGTGVGNYWDPNAEPRFLAKGFEEIKPAIPTILKGIYRV